MITDQMLVRKWLRIRRHLNTTVSATDYHGILTIQTNSVIIYVAKKSDKMRIKSYLDWVHYDPQTLAKAINSDRVDCYYEYQLKNPNSDPNIWKDLDFEQYMKSYYASRIARASLI